MLSPETSCNIDDQVNGVGAADLAADDLLDGMLGGADMQSAPVVFDIADLFYLAGVTPTDPMVTERVPPAAPSCTPAVQLPLCWGAIIKGDFAACSCTPAFKGAPDKANVKFKDHFCPLCNEDIEVDANRVRALSAELELCYRHDRAAGFWKTAAGAVGGGQFRLANHTAACTIHPPKLVIYRGEPPELQWAQMPEKWVENGKVHFKVAKDTLVPVAAMGSPGTKVPNKRLKGAESTEFAAHIPLPEPSFGEAPLGDANPVSSEPPSASARSSPDLRPPTGHDSGASSPTPTPALNRHTALDPLKTSSDYSEVSAASSDLRSSTSSMTHPELTDPVVPDKPEQLASQLLPWYESAVSLLDASLQAESRMRGRLTTEQEKQLFAQLESAKQAVKCLYAMGGRPEPGPVREHSADSVGSRVSSSTMSTPFSGKRAPLKKPRSSSGPARLTFFQQTAGILGSRRNSVSSRRNSASSRRGSAQDDSQVPRSGHSPSAKHHQSPDERRAHESRRDSQTDGAPFRRGSSHEASLRRGPSHDSVLHRASSHDGLSESRRGSLDEASAASHHSRNSRASRTSRASRDSRRSSNGSNRTSFADPMDDREEFPPAPYDPSNSVIQEPSISMTERRVNTVRGLGERALSDSNLLSKGASVKSLRRMFSSKMANLFGKKGKLPSTIGEDARPWQTSSM